ncbi:WGR domain-containing protein [Hyalangium rubrum]|uniref:WGR domain-containing protein n=1 Tax=Hyalangium rubrum TaxID=3103134 RepID=A0ABU5H4I8_9BACT|nr:WGR domain-containing protein [Hyalangium sp. s54d21]MDY7228378.1 WGR domain-containing protein [Hyalangium sp. s54d21]
MRRFEFVEGSSSKFWIPELEGSTFIVTYGRIGTAGQRKEKAFPDEESARREYERKVAEKVREGYKEVSAEGEAPAPAPEKKEKAPPPKAELPRRVRPAKPTAEQVTAAAQALSALEGRLGKRSWQVRVQARRARRVLRSLGGIDPAAHASLGPAFDALMARVVAPKGEERLPLRLAMMLLAELDVAAFVRATQLWKRAPAGAPASASAVALASEVEALGEPELALRVGVLLAERPELRGGSEPGWQRRWSLLKPHLEAHFQQKGGTLEAHLRTLEKGGDPHLAQRASRMGA